MLRLERLLVDREITQKSEETSRATREAENHLCGICNSKSFQKLWSGPSVRERSDQAYHLLVCHNCGLGIIRPFPSIREIRNAYPADYIIYTATYGEQVFSRWKSWVFRMRKKLLTYPPVSSPDGPWKPIFPKDARVLDVGCGPGMYLYFLKMQGYHDIHGLEMDKKAADFGRQMSLDIQTATIKESQLAPDSFDVIRLSHVLEHLPDPKSDIRELVRALRPGGLLLVRTPNLRSVEARGFKSRWVHWDPPRHIYYFTPRSGITLLRDCGLFAIKVIHDGRGFALAKGLEITSSGKFFDRQKIVVDRKNNPFFIAAVKFPSFILDMLRVGSEIVFVARKS